MSNVPVVLITTDLPVCLVGMYEGTGYCPIAEAQIKIMERVYCLRIFKEEIFGKEVIAELFLEENPFVLLTAEEVNLVYPKLANALTEFNVPIPTELRSSLGFLYPKKVYVIPQ